MKLAKRIGMRKAKVAIARKIAVDPSLHLGRRNVVRLGPGKGSLIRFSKSLVRSAGLAMSRWDGVVVTSVIRLVAARPYSAVDVEAPDPDIIMRRCATSERTMTPAKTSTSPGDPMPWPAKHVSAALAPSPQPDQLRRREHYYRAVESSEM